MKLNYDNQADALYLRLDDSKRRSNIFSVNSVRLTEGCQRFFVDLG